MTPTAALVARGRGRLLRFCVANNLPVPTVTVTGKEDWYVDACGYYRPVTDRGHKRLPTGINICPARCARPATGDRDVRNWNWPGSTTDRTPFGVIAHELGHHADWFVGGRKGTYYSEYCEQVMTASGEPPLTSYAPNPSEWFAEHFRLFVTNGALLEAVRPKTYRELQKKFTPVSGPDWLAELGPNVPERVVRALRNKMK